MRYNPLSISGYYDSVQEARYYENHPDENPIDGSEPMSRVMGELEEPEEKKDEDHE